MKTSAYKTNIFKGNDSTFLSLLNHIIDPCKSKSVCFLCFKVCDVEYLLQVQETLEIHGKDYSCRISLANMFTELFGGHDYVTDQVCETCSSTILNIYTILKRCRAHTRLLCSIIKDIDGDIDSKMAQALTDDRTCHINIKLKYETIHCDDYVAEKQMTVDTVKAQCTDNTEKCNKCQMTFANSGMLQKHKRIAHYTLNKAIICDVCGKDYKTPSALKLHINGHNNKSCPYCEKLLKTNSHYRLHLISHLTGAKREKRTTLYKCNECPYESKNKKSLEAHINKVHLKIRPFVCEVCQKGFYKLSNLKEHYDTHTEVKHTCHICGDGFSTNKCLIEHLRLHSGVRSYQCEMCGNGFVSATRRNEHVKRKHGDKCEMCNLCGKKYSLKKDLNRHFKKVHS